MFPFPFYLFSLVKLRVTTDSRAPVDGVTEGRWRAKQHLIHTDNECSGKESWGLDWGAWEFWTQ